MALSFTQAGRPLARDQISAAMDKESDPIDIVKDNINIGIIINQYGYYKLILNNRDPVNFDSKEQLMEILDTELKNSINSTIPWWPTIAEVLDDKLFKYLLFDPYLQDSNGTGQLKVANGFKHFLEKYCVESASASPYWTPFINACEEADSTSAAVQVIFSGWETRTQPGGHSIYAVFDKKSETDYDVFIINSGSGIENHGNAVDGKFPIIIHYKGITNSQILQLHQLFNFMRDKDSIQRIRLETYIESANRRDLPRVPFESQMFSNEALRETINTHVAAMRDNYELNEATYYEYLSILLPNPRIVFKYDRKQFSGSCAVYSCYYFIKYFLIEANFTAFLKNVIDEYSNEFVLKVIPAIHNARNETNGRFGTLINISHIILKDYRKTAVNPVGHFYKEFSSTWKGEIVERVSDGNFQTLMRAYADFCTDDANLHTFKNLQRFIIKIKALKFEDVLKKDICELLIIKCAYIQFNRICEAVKAGHIALEENFDSFQRNQPAEFILFMQLIDFNLLKVRRSSNNRVSQYSFHFVLISSFLSLIREPLTDIQSNLNDITDPILQDCIVHYFNSSNTTHTLLPIDFNFQETLRKVIIFRKWLFKNDARTPGNVIFLKSSYFMNFDALQHRIKFKGLCEHEPTEFDLQYLIDGVNSGQIEIVNPFLKAIGIIAESQFTRQVMYLNREEEDTRVTTHAGEAHIHAHQTMFMDMIQYIRMLDKNNFKNLLPRLNYNVIDILAYCFYITKDEFYKDPLIQTMVKANPNLYMASVFENNLFHNYNDIYVSNGELILVPNLEKRCIFSTLFFMSQLNDDMELLQQISMREEIDIASGTSKIVGKPINNILSNYIIYHKHGEGENILRCRRNDRETIVVVVGERYTRTFADTVYELVPPPAIASTDGHLQILLSKLNCSRESYSVWKNGDRLLIDLDESKQSCFLIARDTIYYYDNVGTQYTVLTTFDALEGIWVFQMTNGFLLQRENDRFLLLCINNDYVGEGLIMKDDYWYKFMHINRPNYLLSPKHFQYVLRIHNTRLSVKTNQIEETISLFLSLHIANNMIGLNLMAQTFRNVFLNKLSSTNSSMFEFDEDICKINIPLWALYENLNVGDTFSSATPELDERINYLNITPAVAKADYRIMDEPAEIVESTISLIKKTNGTRKCGRLTHRGNAAVPPLNSAPTQLLSVLPKYKALRQLSDQLCELKHIFHSEGQSSTLQNYLKDFRHKCEACTSKDKLLSKDAFAAFTTIAPLPTDDIFNSLYKKSNELLSIPNIFLEYYQAFYFHMFELLFDTILRKLTGRASADDCTADNFDCGQILKQIEFLDSYLIHDLVTPRQISEIMFEIQEELFLRQEQVAALAKLHESIQADRPVKAYEILMGRGKTSTLTPMMLLHSYFQGNREASVVLPTHLVPSSFDIMMKFSNILYGVHILKSTDNKLYNSLTHNIVHIVSDSVLKSILLDNMGLAVSAVPTVPTVPIPSLYIFDEVDTLLNPFKNYLNKPFGDMIDHPRMEQIVSLLFQIVYDDANIETSVNTSAVEEKRQFIQKLSSIVPSAKALVFNQNYGFGIKPTIKLELKSIQKFSGFFTAIPYIANNFPADGSSFSDFELSLCLTMLSYKRNGLRREDVFLLLLSITKFINPLRKYFKEDVLLQIISRRYTVLAPFAPTILEFVSLYSLGKPYDVQFETIYNGNKTNDDVIKYYLNTIIFHYFFKIHIDQLNISTVDLFHPSVSSVKVSFSGTVNFNKPADLIGSIYANREEIPPGMEEFQKGQIDVIEPDRAVGGAIEASFHGYTLTPETVPTIFKYNASDVDKERKLLDFVKTSITTYNALIDCAGLILNTKPIDVVKELFEVEKATNPDSERHFLYIDENNIKREYSEHEQKKYDNEIYDDLFIYYDHKNCVGVDFKQPHKMKGLVTISKTNTLTEVAQATYRLRNINIGHGVDFYCFGASEERITNDHVQLTALYNNLTEKDNKFKVNSKEYSDLQCLKYMYRCAKNRSKDSFKEEIYYDLKPNTEGRLVSYTDVMNKYLETVSAEPKLSGLRFRFGERNAQEQQIVVSVEQEHQQEEEKQQQQQQRIGELRHYFSKNGDKVEAYLSMNLNYKMEMFGSISTDLMKIQDMEIILSHTFLKCYLMQSTCIQSDYYLLVNGTIPNKVLIITIVEKMSIINLIEKGLAGDYTIKIFNNDGYVCFKSGADFAWNWSPIFQLTVFKNMSIMKQFTLIKSITYVQYIKIKRYKALLNRDYSFTLDLSEETYSALEKTQYESWKRLFRLPALDDDLQRVVLESFNTPVAHSAGAYRRRFTTNRKRFGAKTMRVKRRR